MRTLSGEGRARLTEKRSRFLAFAYPVESREEIEAHLAELRRRFHDARHIACAWRLRGEERADDAGEPAGSAGRPILQLLQGQGLDGVLVAVVRYFGGVKLGVGGLARAYREAARLALEDAGTEEVVPRVEVSVRVPVSRLGDALAALGRLRADIASQDFQGGQAEVSAVLPAEALPALERAVAPWGVLERR